MSRKEQKSREHYYWELVDSREYESHAFTTIQKHLLTAARIAHEALTTTFSHHPMTKRVAWLQESMAKKSSFPPPRERNVFYSDDFTDRQIIMDRAFISA